MRFLNPLIVLCGLGLGLGLGLSLSAGAQNAAQNPFEVTSLIQDWQSVRDRGQATWQLRVDNDSLLLNRDDGFYTSGFALGQSWRLARNGASLVAGWRFGQALYTASDINLPPARVGPPDHPYAGWLYLGAFREMQNTDGSALRLSVDVGCLGPCAGGERTQKSLHRLIQQPQPQGWARQVRNEVGVVFGGEWHPGVWKFSPNFEIDHVLRGRLGNIHTDVGLDLVARGGMLGVLGQRGDYLYGFSRVGIRAVGYDATLQGGLFSSSSPHTVKPKRAVGELEAGLAWQSSRWALTASVIRRGNEIDGLPNAAGRQNFVRLDMTYTP